MDNGETSNDTNDSEETNRGVLYIYALGFFFGFFILITISYISYIYKRRLRFQSPPPLPPVISFAITNDNIDDNNHVIKFSNGLDDNVLVTFPTFVYSDVMIHHKENNSNDCSVCLADYNPSDVIRLLPECGHFFHVKCIDTWLKVHPTCPVCRILVWVYARKGPYLEWNLNRVKLRVETDDSNNMYVIARFSIC
ncbi:putative RING-H2 finger protein ATL71 [Rutidosis leptorrhynchoides]|uniref:putative RING-H2 finger protein ATL71 n=1 Tax=Rutidosis leptorrhynchoides TaxID=125765 RepID=UPI003A99F975